MKINYKRLIISVFLPLVLGGLIGFITSPSSNYKDMITPSFQPPAIVFPIVWTILYILMGISSYIVLSSKKDVEVPLKYYILQLIVNLLWPVIFFTLQMYKLSFVLILVLIYLVIRMIIEFYKINKTSAYLQIPYLLWLIFASILNLAISILN